MTLFQWRRIDPTADEIDWALADARAAGDGRHPNGLERRAALAAATAPSGVLGWGGEPAASRRYGRVGCAWWTDAVGRRHWYVEGDVYSLEGSSDPAWRFRDGVAVNALWAIGWPRVVCQGAEVDAPVLVVCDCGAVGTPEKVAWTGDRCGPCFDRRVEDASWAVPPLAVQAHRRHVSGLAFASGSRVVSCTWADASLWVYDPRTGEEHRPSLGVAVERGPNGLSMLPDDRVVVSYTRGVVACWDLAAGELAWEGRCRAELMGVAASPLGNFVAVDAVTVQFLVDADTGDSHSLSEDYAQFAFSADGDVLYTFDHNPRCVVAVDPFTEEATETGLEFGEPEEDDCYSLACHPTRPLLASGGDNGRVRLGDPAARRWLWVNDGPAGLVSHLAFTPDGRTLATGHDDLVVFWDVDTGTQRAALRIPGYGVAGLAFSPDGETLAFGDAQGVVRIWPWGRLIG